MLLSASVCKLQTMLDLCITFASGVDFLGWVHFSDHRVLRGATKNRMFRNLDREVSKEIIQSYIGLLSHGNGYKLKKLVKRYSDSISRN